MKNHDETIDTVFRRIGEYEAAKKRRKTLIFRTAAPLCCLMVLVCVVLRKPSTLIMTPPATEVTVTDKPDNFLVATEPLTDHLDVVVIPHIDSIPSSDRMLFALMLDDFIRMNQEELCAYYGTNVFPTVPDDLILSSKSYGIFKRESGTGEIYWDSNYISFFNSDASRSVIVNVDSDRIPFDFCNLFDEIKNRSTINGIDVGIAKTDHGEFYAEFMCNGTGFRVVANGLEKEEFIDVLKSLTA